MLPNCLFPIQSFLLSAYTYSTKVKMPHFDVKMIVSSIRVQYGSVLTLSRMSQDRNRVIWNLEHFYKDLTSHFILKIVVLCCSRGCLNLETKDMHMWGQELLIWMMKQISWHKLPSFMDASWCWTHIPQEQNLSCDVHFVILMKLGGSGWNSSNLECFAYQYFSPTRICKFFFPF